MQITAIDNYLTTLAQVAELRARVASTAKLIQLMGERLKASPLKVMLFNTPSDVAYPAKLMGGDGVLSVDAQAWPSGEDLGRLLANYHAALLAAQRAFEAIPESYRGAVLSPPEA